MQDEKKFMQMLRDIVDVAKINGNTISTKEVDEYFEELNLDEKQREAVYDYLYKGHITVVGYTKINSGNSDEAGKPENDNKQSDIEIDVIEKESVRTKHYRKSVKELSNSMPGLEYVYGQIKAGEYEESIREDIINIYLPVVTNIASRYSGKGVSGDELIQEGNLALILAVDELLHKMEETVLKSVNSFDVYMRNRIRESIIGCIDAEIEIEGGIQAALGKAQLVKDAAAHLSKELGRVASVFELSEYTHIDEEEIEDIIRFSGNIVSTGDGDDLKN